MPKFRTFDSRNDRNTYFDLQAVRTRAIMQGHWRLLSKLVGNVHLVALHLSSAYVTVRRRKYSCQGEVWTKTRLMQTRQNNQTSFPATIFPGKSVLSLHDCLFLACLQSFHVFLMHLFLCHMLNQAVSIMISMFVLLNQLGWDDGSLQMAGISFPACICYL